jgi:hypothetical protein
VAGVFDPHAVGVWLYGAVTGDGAAAALLGDRVFPNVAPQDEDGHPDADFPLLVHAANTARVSRVAGSPARAYTRVRMALLVYVRGEDPAAAAEVFQALEAALVAAGSGAGGTVIVGGTAYRIRLQGHDAPFLRSERHDNGESFEIAGAMFDFFVETG